MVSLILSGAVVAVCVIVHYEALVILSRTIRGMNNHRVAILIAMFGLLIAHVIEIWIFALSYFVFGELFGLGEITDVNGLMDYAYYSAVVYTTLGFGDLLPTDVLRILTGAESLAGLALITWSATFTLAMGQKLWDTAD